MEPADPVAGRGEAMVKAAEYKKDEDVQRQNQDAEGDGDEGEEVPDGIGVITDRFKVISYTGDLRYRTFPENVLQDEGIHCSKPGKNFDLLLEFNNPKGAIISTLVSLVVKMKEYEEERKTTFAKLTTLGGGDNKSKFIHIMSTQVFVSEGKPRKGLKYAKVFDSVTDKNMFESKVEDMKESDSATPVGYLETDEESLEGILSITPWAKGRYVHMRFLRPHADANIDIDRIHILGVVPESAEFSRITSSSSSTTKPLAGIEVGRDACMALGASRPPLSTFNEFRFDLMERIQSGTIALLLLPTPASQREIEGMNQFLAGVAEIAQREWTDSGLEFYYHVFDLGATDPTTRAASFLRGLFVSQDHPGMVLGIRESDGTRYLFDSSSSSGEKKKKELATTADDYEDISVGFMSWCEMYTRGEVAQHWKSEKLLGKIVPPLPSSTEIITRESFQESLAACRGSSLVCVHYNGLQPSPSLLAPPRGGSSDAKGGMLGDAETDGGARCICVCACVDAVVTAAVRKTKKTAAAKEEEETSPPFKCFLFDYEANDVEPKWLPDELAPPFLAWFSKAGHPPGKSSAKKKKKSRR
eukprot:jgi/Bigna1/71552/fgenesh1_pg.16_\